MKIIDNTFFYLMVVLLLSQHMGNKNQLLSIPQENKSQFIKKDLHLLMKKETRYHKNQKLFIKIQFKKSVK